MYVYDKLVLHDITPENAGEGIIVFALDHPTRNSCLRKVESRVVKGHYILKNQDNVDIEVVYNETEAKKKMHDYLKREALKLEHNLLEDCLNNLETYRF